MNKRYVQIDVEVMLQMVHINEVVRRNGKRTNYKSEWRSFLSTNLLEVAIPGLSGCIM